jgi:hypothetical protein
VQLIVEIDYEVAGKPHTSQFETRLRFRQPFSAAFALDIAADRCAAAARFGEGGRDANLRSVLAHVTVTNGTSVPVELQAALLNSGDARRAVHVGPSPLPLVRVLRVSSWNVVLSGERQVLGVSDSGAVLFDVTSLLAGAETDVACHLQLTYKTTPAAATKSMPLHFATSLLLPCAPSALVVELRFESAAAVVGCPLHAQLWVQAPPDVDAVTVVIEPGAVWAVHGPLVVTLMPRDGHAATPLMLLPLAAGVLPPPAVHVQQPALAARVVAPPHVIVGAAPALLVACRTDVVSQSS